MRYLKVAISCQRADKDYADLESLQLSGYIYSLEND